MLDRLSRVRSALVAIMAIGGLSGGVRLVDVVAVPWLCPDRPATVCD